MKQRLIFLIFTLLLHVSFCGAAIESVMTKKDTKKVELQSLIEPPLPLSQELPISLSYANRQAFLQNPEVLGKEAEQNVTLMKDREFPWFSSLAVLGVLLTVALVRWLPSNLGEAKRKEQTTEEREKEIEAELQNMALSLPKNGNEAKNFILKLDILLRRYLLVKYEFPAFSLTKEELFQTLNSVDLTPSIKEGMNNTFKKADQIKFAQVLPNLNDCQNLVTLLKGCIQDVSS